MVVLLLAAAGFVYYTNRNGQPKGLIPAALANMGERFGFYIMMAILTLFISSKFGLNKTQTGLIYSIFYASIYVLALVGGIIADKTKNYKGTILTGLILMAVGYLVIAFPTETPVANLPLILSITCLGLLIIAFGNGLFKGNLQAVVGQLYDDPKYSDKRDVGFQIFYMFINIGGFFAPFIAIGVRNWWLQAKGFLYNADLPELCHQYLRSVNGGEPMTEQASARLLELANSQSLNGVAVLPEQIGEFVNNYLNVFSTGFHYAFAAAIVAMMISLVIFIINRKNLPDPNKKAADKNGNTPSKEEIKMDVKEIRQRIYALFAVFAVVIFFWFSFHQNGYSLTYFARDFVNLDVIKIDLGFTQIVGAEIFQSVNPFFVVFLTPIIIGIFGGLRARGKEPSTPMKIGIGMGIAALAYVFLTICSTGLPTSAEIEQMGGLPAAQRLSPWVMVGTYFILTTAELFISPLGLSFVSKVAPPHLQGIMQGCWLAATAVGNQLLFIGGILYDSIPLWATWVVFVGACAISMFAMLGMVRWLERITEK
ncbi:MAG: peptide MFS transporter [Bacteroidales bacterium]|nr:peptide MFS transporter [Bacteroidales bacterium]